MGVRLISINWTPVTDSTVTGYNIYLVQGAPALTTRQLLAFQAGRSTGSYNYTVADETQHYQFEVRATDGTHEGPPLEIFYPDGGMQYTPTLITPTGVPMMNAKDSQYLSKDDFINYPTGLKLTTSSALYTSGVLDVILQVASAEVNRYCHRRFDVQTIDEVYDNIAITTYEPRMITVQLNNSPIQNINSVYIQVLKYFIKFDLSYLQVFPDKGYYQLVPFLGDTPGTGSPLPSAILTQNIIAKVWTNYTFGYDVLPTAIKFATSILATKLIGLQENPVGAKRVSFGRNFQLEWDKDHDPLYQKVGQLLNPYRVSFYRTT